MNDWKESNLYEMRNILSKYLCFLLNFVSNRHSRGLKICKSNNDYFEKFESLLSDIEKYENLEHQKSILFDLTNLSDIDYNTKLDNIGNNELSNAVEEEIKLYFADKKSTADQKSTGMKGLENYVALSVR